MTAEDIAKPDWIAVKDQLPTEDEAVATKIEDGDGYRGERWLRLSDGIWYLGTHSMYIAPHPPTHWRPINKPI
jgi:hypothetical protein